MNVDGAEDGPPRFSTLIAWSDEDRCYVALCPDLPRVSAAGATIQRAAEAFQVALDDEIERYREREWPLPRARGIRSLDMLANPQVAEWKRSPRGK